MGIVTVVSDLSQPQRERLAYLELRAYFTGELRRTDIEARFGVKPAAVSRDLATYRELAPDNLEYDQGSKCYRPSAGFTPVFPFSPDRVLSWLLQGFGDGLDLRLKKAAPCEGPGTLVRPDLDILASVTRALCAKRPLKITYLSLSSGTGSRVIVPVALADNGLRWHVRAYDRTRQRFSDFVLTRITKAKVLDEEAAEHEQLAADEQWARIVDLELVPHPDIEWPKAVEADYGMKDGVLKVRARAALAGYVLRRWTVDATPDHSMDVASHHLWLRNTPTLYGVESAALAPGHAPLNLEGQA
jgi:predicted DNA-binding transcriptional regulator YafY